VAPGASPAALPVVFTPPAAGAAFWVPETGHSAKFQSHFSLLLPGEEHFFLCATCPGACWCSGRGTGPFPCQLGRRLQGLEKQIRLRNKTSLSSCGQKRLLTTNLFPLTTCGGTNAWGTSTQKWESALGNHSIGGARNNSLLPHKPLLSITALPSAGRPAPELHCTLHHSCSAN
jgi:hypothetical protein